MYDYQTIALVFAGFIVLPFVFGAVVSMFK
jgi:hypothetical protein